MESRHTSTVGRGVGMADVCLLRMAPARPWWRRLKMHSVTVQMRGHGVVDGWHLPEFASAAIPEAIVSHSATEYRAYAGKPSVRRTLVCELIKS